MKMKKAGGSPVGLYSHKSNPMPKPKQVPVGLGSNSNKDAQKANKLLMKAQVEIDSQRGLSGC
jgi:hypothetical protein